MRFLRRTEASRNAKNFVQALEIDGWPAQNETTALLLVTGIALTIRIYLSLTSYCISGDGVAYLAMAHHFSHGEWLAGLDSVYSPLYPALISLMHRWVTDWEMAGNLVSTVLGTAAVMTTYLMTRAAFGRRDLASGAAVLIAVHPEIAAYSASVRTEAGYIFFTTAACWLLLKAVNERRVQLAAIAGLMGGLAYLYRTEAVGFFLLGILLLTADGLRSKQATHFWIASICAFSLVFMVIAAPYLAYLRVVGGHWSIGREFNAAMMYGMGDVAQNGEKWRQLGWSSDSSPLFAILGNPGLYAEKVGRYCIISIYSFVQGLGPLLAVLLVVGIWTHRHRLFRTLNEVFLATIVLFYFCGFTLSYTGTRFMVHLIPFTFGWVTAGIIAVSAELAKWCRPTNRVIAYALVPTVIALTLIPRTLWPIGYDMRGVRYAGEAIAQMTNGQAAVAARDGRVAYYARARLIELPASPPEDLCAWLHAKGGDFLMVGNHDERRFGVAHGGRCLALVKRYPRYGSGYYDLYEVTQPQQGLRPSTSNAG
ncbi:MAG TPA: glycosyltransferase family 39 protein [Candidatus Binataceae bacterium]|nr:glycosyltransferase family 39 protein [Candidatus Binataceae bacterium]